MNDLRLFKHIFIDNKADKTLFLLHGTGGTEKDLLPFVESLHAKYNVVALKGNISEKGLTRFFMRSAEGVFDMVSMRAETKKLHNFLTAWYDKHNLTARQAAFVGYSNGANMILATTFLYPDLISQGVLLHPMLPFKPEKLSLKGKSFVVTYGESDSMVPAVKSVELSKLLKKLGAKVEVVSHHGGHEIRHSEVEALLTFLS